MTVKSKPLLQATNPFLLHQEIPPLHIAKSLLLSVTLLPLRLFLMLPILGFAWLVTAVTLPGISQEQARGLEPLTGWRRRWCKPFVVSLARLVFFVGGWYWIPQRGCRATAKEAPILLVVPHSSFLDTVLVIALGCPGMVAKDSTERTPFFGKLVKYTQPLLVKSEDPDSRRQIAAEIRERVTSGKDFEQLLLFPEGGCGNRKALLQFKLGGFSPGVPVQPVYIRYGNRLDTITWSWDGPGALKQLWLTLTQFRIVCELEFLPVYRPSEIERQNPRLFADNVRNYVSSWTETTTSPFGVEDARYLKKVQESDLPVTVALVKLFKLRKALGTQDVDAEKELQQLRNRRNSFHPMTGDVEHLASYLGLESAPEALKDFFRLVDQDGKGRVDVRVYDAGLCLLRADLKEREKLKEAFRILGGSAAENLQTILLYWKGVSTSKATLKALDKLDPEELPTS